MAAKREIYTAIELASMPKERADRIIAQMSVAQRVFLQSWAGWRRDDQCEPDGDWRNWLVMAGRGYGKTRMGAEWVRERALTFPGVRIALVAGNISEARHIMVEGESGLLSLLDDKPPHWSPSLGRVDWVNGSQAYIYSASEPDGLRGPQYHFAWCDEIAKWVNGEAAWDNLQMGLRLGDHPQLIATTTPRPVALLRRILQDERSTITKGRTVDNAAMLPQPFLEAMQQQYQNTRLGRQELEGELIEELEGALWNRALIENSRIKTAPDMQRILIGVDPPASAHGDDCGIVVCGLGVDRKGYILADATVSGASPDGWARIVANSAEIWSADRVIAEANQGGAMVETTLRAANINLPVRLVHASRGKVARAEPVAALFEAGRACFAGAFPMLEDQLCGLLVGGQYEGPGRSPDRADAMVWAMTELMLGKKAGGPRARLL